ncbi:MAG: hypothetical protein IJP62_08890 [Treponema sp.]|nr:hypothetical protein [Treponema sp.]
MCQMNVLEAKTHFSKIIAMLENHEEEEVIVARAGKPVVRIVLMPEKNDISKRLGMFRSNLKHPQLYDKKFSEAQENPDDPYDKSWDPCAWSEDELREMFGDDIFDDDEEEK